MEILTLLLPSVGGTTMPSNTDAVTDGAVYLVDNIGVFANSLLEVGYTTAVTFEVDSVVCSETLLVRVLVSIVLLLVAMPSGG